MNTELPMKTYSTGKMVVNWTMVNGSYNFGERIVEVIANKIVEKIAKASGNKRKERRLTVRLNGFEDEYECGTESFKKGSFLKNLIKKSVHKLIETMNKPSSLLPMVYNPIRKNFLGITDKESLEYMGHCLMVESDDDKAIRRTYKQFAKLYHPDYLGRELFPDEVIVLEVLKETKEIALMNYRDMMEVLSDLED